VRLKEEDVKEDPLQPQRCARLLAALAAPERLRIMRFLRAGPRNAGEIAEMLQTTTVNTSHHLNVLKSAGLLENERRGRFIYYFVVPGILLPEEDEGKTEQLDLGCCRLELPLEDGDTKKGQK